MKKVYKKQVEDLRMFEFPPYITDKEIQMKFFEILTKCISKYKASLPTKESLVYAYMVLYAKGLRTDFINNIIDYFGSVEREFLKDAYDEFYDSGLHVKFDDMIAPLAKDERYNINKIVYLDYVLRHPELIEGMFEIKELEHRFLCG
ncbi:MAG: hypothetical protein MJ170_02355 [Alphaproteobacteria bacterium]|nr:hypothetical protein [Alphaproteobacteria bacterium]